MRAITRGRTQIFRDSGNVASPQAKGVLCNTDVGGARPVRQRARRIGPEFLEATRFAQSAPEGWSDTVLLVAVGIPNRRCVQEERRRHQALQRLLNR
ncbi:hypothetical protein PybrP1_005679 [[Pythium] brassicae (nom. inval.)]|nr:hypothetical protein PybrP1_005679 [[Pythium] brassicae (nom. inval.)]